MFGKALKTFEVLRKNFQCLHSVLEDTEELFELGKNILYWEEEIIE
jgi:hypothetical protein